MRFKGLQLQVDVLGGLKMDQYDGKRVVVTGGTSGIALVTAKRLLDQLARVLKAFPIAREE